MLDMDLIVQSLKDKGHEVGPIFPVPDNAGEEEFTVDGEILTLTEVRALLANESA